MSALNVSAAKPDAADLLDIIGRIAADPNVLSGYAQALKSLTRAELCVAACDGIPDIELQTGLPLKQRLARLRAKRDALTTALEGVVSNSCCRIMHKPIGALAYDAAVIEWADMQAALDALEEVYP